MAGRQLLERRPAARVVHGLDVEAGQHLEQLARDMRRAPGAGRRHLDLGGIGLGESDQLGDVLRWHRRMHHQHQRLAGDAGDRRDVAQEHEIELFGQ